MAPDAVVKQVLEALAASKAIHLIYTDVKGEDSERTILPYYLVQGSHNVPYIWAYCSKRGDARTFRADRINSMSIGSKAVSADTYKRCCVGRLSQGPTGEILGQAQWQA